MIARSATFVAFLLVACSGPARYGGGDPTPDLADSTPIATDAQLDRRCAAGEGDACAERAQRRIDSEEPAAVKRGLGELAAACDAHAPKACFYLGNAYRLGVVVDRDPKRAAERYDVGCASGSGGACHELAALLSGEDLGEPDLPRAAKLDGRACELEPRLCLHIGFRHQEGLGVERDLKTSRRAYRTSCDHGDGVACHRLGELLAVGAGGDQDTPAALRLFERACEAGTAPSCANLGLVYLQGELGVTPDPKRGVTLLDRACELGDAIGCANLGAATEQGLGGLGADPARAARLYEKACDDGASNGCTFLGVMHLQGQAVAKDPARANTLFRQACDGGYGPGCTWLGASYLEGIGVAADRKRARGLFQRACDLGEQAACDALR